MKRFIVIVLLVLELSILGYAALMAWLLSVWFLDDHVASQMSPVDWWFEASERFVICVLGAAFFAVVTYLVASVALGACRHCTEASSSRECHRCILDHCCGIACRCSAVRDKQAIYVDCRRDYPGAQLS